MYEVILDNCDGLRAIIYLQENGKVDYNGNYYNKVKRLARLCKESIYDKEMPEWGKEIMRKLEK